ncbi:D-alanyl-D-alanine carboxypeptidase [Paenibacillus sp. JCM 10914]|nr:D-alanyl-D-alanine carboxypeptidase [Paenibacillus sp. JCM 10914]
MFDYGFAKTLTWKERLDNWFIQSGTAAVLSFHRNHKY